MPAPISFLLNLGPLLFGLCFLAPLITQTLDRLGWTAPLEMTHLAFGLAAGGTLGLIANIRGRWL